MEFKKGDVVKRVGLTNYLNSGDEIRAGDIGVVTVPCYDYHNPGVTKVEFNGSEDWYHDIYLELVESPEYEVIKPFTIFDIYKLRPARSKLCRPEVDRDFEGMFESLLIEGSKLDGCTIGYWSYSDWNDILESPVLMTHLKWLEGHGFIKEVIVKEYLKRGMEFTLDEFELVVIQTGYKPMEFAFMITNDYLDCRHQILENFSFGENTTLEDLQISQPNLKRVKND